MEVRAINMAPVSGSLSFALFFTEKSQELIEKESLYSLGSNFWLINNDTFDFIHNLSMDVQRALLVVAGHAN